MHHHLSSNPPKPLERRLNDDEDNIHNIVSTAYAPIVVQTSSQRRQYNFPLFPRPLSSFDACRQETHDCLNPSLNPIRSTVVSTRMATINLNVNLSQLNNPPPPTAQVIINHRSSIIVPSLLGHWHRRRYRNKKETQLGQSGSKQHERLQGGGRIGPTLGHSISDFCSTARGTTGARGMGQYPTQAQPQIQTQFKRTGTSGMGDELEEYKEEDDEAMEGECYDYCYVYAYPSHVPNLNEALLLLLLHS
ncbi:hypothetical protein F5880DRAFT_1682522 [Lentinula raphanica]|nr:hypothetical protein F5880DRAFT_1682522 [Lentinula raphanica]